MWGFFCGSGDDLTLTSCSPVHTHYQTTQRHMPRDGSCTNPTGCCRYTCGPLPLSVPQRTTDSSHNFRTSCPRWKMLLWCMTLCRRVSGRWVQAFWNNKLSPFPVLYTGILIKVSARWWMSCPKGWTAVRLLFSTVLWTSPHPSQGQRTTSFPTKADQTWRSRDPVFGEKLSVLTYVSPVQFIGKCGYTVQLQLEGRILFADKI